ncbi:MAG: Histidyl-tRNA synthetase, partial [uncultured Rubellimicrobium sp.]
GQGRQDPPPPPGRNAQGLPRLFRRRGDGTRRHARPHRRGLPPLRLRGAGNERRGDRRGPWKIPPRRGPPERGRLRLEGGRRLARAPLRPDRAA